MKISQNLQTTGKIISSVIHSNVSYLIIFVTARCNLLCKHCFYTEEIQNAKSKKELSLDEYTNVASKIGPLTNVNFTGGEPFIRQDLDKIILAFRNYTGVPFIGITTNGLLTAKIVDTVDKICCQTGPYFLKLGISLDGFKNVHDETRNKQGGFNQTIETILKLDSLRKKHNNLMVYVSTTITKLNKNSILEFIDFVKNELPVDSHYLGYIRGKVMVEETKEVSIDEYRTACSYLKNQWNKKSRFFNLLNLANSLMTEVNQEILQTGKFVMPCVAGQKMVTITEEGLIKPCEMLEQIGVSPYTMGDLRENDYDINKILQTANARKIRERIIKERCVCTFECANQASIVYKPKNLIKALQIKASRYLNESKLFN